MMRGARSILWVAFVAFVAAIAGVVIGRTFVAPVRPVETELHDVLHQQIRLDAGQQARIKRIETDFAVRRHALEQELRADNARLAAAIEAEHGYGPKVSAAIDRSHGAMGQLQKETLEHIFAMRDVLTPEQAKRFDAIVVKALTAAEK